MTAPRNRVETIFADANSVGEFAAGYFQYLAEVLARVEHDALERVVTALLEARERGHRIYILGNGGSAATAGHFASDLLIGLSGMGKPFHAESLSENTAVITAVSNDFGYEQVFTRQLDGRLQAGDLVIAFSASGNSPNVLAAVDFGNERGAITIGVTGFDGGQLRQRAQIAVHVPTEQREYGPAEDAHLALEHMLSNYLLLRLRETTG